MLTRNTLICCTTTIPRRTRDNYSSSVPAQLVSLCKPETMSYQAPPPTEPATDSLNSDATTTNLEGAVQEAVTTDTGIPIDGETPSIAADLEVPVPIDSEIKDTQMADAPSEQPPQSSAPIASAATPDSGSRAPSPAPIPARVSTPMRNSNSNANANGGEGERTSSRAASVHPDTGFTMPTEAPVHGAPVRQYINTKITAVLLEGMKMVAREQPKDPLRVLGEFLLQRSQDLEGTAP